MKKRLTIGIVLLTLLLLAGCESPEVRFCLEDIGKEFCEERGERFDKAYTDAFSTWGNFECFNEERQFVEYKFAKAEVRHCYNTSG